MKNKFHYDSKSLFRVVGIFFDTLLIGILILKYINFPEAAA